MDSAEISKEREAFYNCSQSCWKGLSQSENSPFSWTFPALTTMPTEINSSPPTDSSIHGDPQARELADVLKRILQSPTHDCPPPSDKVSFLPESADLNSLLCCYGGYFSPLASSQKQLEEYVHELVPALQLIGSTHIVDKGQRQEVMKLAPDAVLTRSATGMGWSRPQTPAATASKSQTKEVSGSLDIVDIGSVVSQQSLHRYSSSRVSVPRASDGIGDLLSDDSGTFSAFESLEVDSSCPGRFEVDKANAFSDGSMVDTTSELIDEDCVLENTENVLPSRLPLYGDGVFSQNCPAAEVIRDEPTSVFSSDSVLASESKALKDLHPGPNEIWELQKRARGMESQIQGGVVSQGVDPLQGTVLGRPCQSGLLQQVVNQNIAMLQGFRAMPRAGEPPMDSSSPLATPTSLLSAAPAQGLLNAAALLGGPGAATPSHRDNMRELAYRVAAFQPINWSKIERITRPKRRNVRISKDPQSIAARRRRERISDRIRILQRLVPGGTRMDTASMLDETINYVKFLKVQVQALQRLENSFNGMYSDHHVFNRNCNNNLGRNDFPLDVAAETPFSGPLINPHQLHFQAASQHDFQSFFSPDQHLHQQPCH